MHWRLFPRTPAVRPQGRARWPRCARRRSSARPTGRGGLECARRSRVHDTCALPHYRPGVDVCFLGGLFLRRGAGPLADARDATRDLGEEAVSHATLPFMGVNVYMRRPTSLLRSTPAPPDTARSPEIAHSPVTRCCGFAGRRASASRGHPKCFTPRSVVQNRAGHVDLRFDCRLHVCELLVQVCWGHRQRPSRYHSRMPHSSPPSFSCRLSCSRVLHDRRDLLPKHLHILRHDAVVDIHVVALAERVPNHVLLYQL